MAARIEIINRETIKPSSATSPDCKSLQLSVLDQIFPTAYVPLLLFYPKRGHHENDDNERSQRLKTSLSETLTHFYPLAGRVKGNVSLECSDDGAEYIEARIKSPLADYLKEPDLSVLKQFFPADVESNEAATGSMLLVQATFFGCGGMAIGVCISHKIADASSLTAFIKFWSATASNNTNNASSPVFMGASIFPQLDFSVPKPNLELTQENCVTKRFVFDALKISNLRAKVASGSVPKPTRVEAVSAFVWKCAVDASRSNLGLHRPSVWSLTVNMRKRLVPPLPENHFGNCVSFIGTHTGEDELDLQDLVSRMRKGLGEFSESYVKKFQGEEGLLAITEYCSKWATWVMSKDIDSYKCTSWCKFDLYDADLGWGKPIWLGIATFPFKNAVLLVDTKDGEGIEVFLTLTLEDMVLFESNQELLEFATVNPSVSSS